MLTVLHSKAFLFKEQNIYRSVDMKYPWKTFTNSKETIKLIGMKELYSIKYDPNDIAATSIQFGLLLVTNI